MSNDTGSWGSELARIWTNYRPPCRPSLSELSIYTKYLRLIQNRITDRKVRLLILGSTSEFRDWGHEENLDVTVVDFSSSYNTTVVEQMKYKNVQEVFVHEKWQNMAFDYDFDLIVGDLVIGNLKRHEVAPFLERISKALNKDGLFMTKSFFRNENHKIKNLREIFTQYINPEAFNHHHVFSTLTYDITLSCMDIETEVLSFRYMYESIYQLFKEGIIDESMMDEFSNFGWQSNMKFEFYVPTIASWESMVKATLQIHAVEYGTDVYSPNFPVYIISK